MAYSQLVTVNSSHLTKIPRSQLVTSIKSRPRLFVLVRTVKMPDYSYGSVWIARFPNSAWKSPLKTWKMVSSSAQTQISIFINVNVIMIIVTDSPQCHLCSHRRLADENVHCAGSATYQIFLGYRTLTITLNPNPITDPNPNPKINKNKTTPEWNWT